MIGLAAAAIVLMPLTAAPDGRLGPLSVVVQASGGQDVSYAIVVRNTSDHAVSDAVITQQLPPSLDYVAASPPPRRVGRHLTWTLTIPAHGTARITTTSAAGHHVGARPLAHVTQAGAVHHRHHRAVTTVCAGEDAGPRACATGRGALRSAAVTRGEADAGILAGAIGGAAAVWGVGVAVWRRWQRRRQRRRACVEG